MSKFRVVVTDDRFGNYKEEEEVLAAIDAKIEVYKLKTEEKTIQAVKDADALLVNLQPIREKVIKNLALTLLLCRTNQSEVVVKLPVNVSNSHVHTV